MVEEEVACGALPSGLGRWCGSRCIAKGSLVASHCAAFRPTCGNKGGCSNSSIFCCPSVSVCQHKVQSPGVIFTLFSAFSSLAPAIRVQIVSPPHREGRGDFPAALAVLTPASGLQKSLYSRRQEEDE